MVDIAKKYSEISSNNRKIEKNEQNVRVHLNFGQNAHVDICGCACVRPENPPPLTVLHIYENYIFQFVLPSMYKEIFH